MSEADALRVSYTMTKMYGRITIYRGALRRVVDNAVIWQCTDEHYGRADHLGEGPGICALRELERRRRTTPEEAQP